MDNVNREVEILKKNKKEMSAIKNTVAEMKKDFDRLISIWDITEERISAFKDMTIETSKDVKESKD